MVLVLALLVSLSGCTQFDIFVEAATDEVTVYDCAVDGAVLELCYLDDSAAELGEQLGATCSRGSRRWVQFSNFLTLGCTYSCPHYGPGCNAHNGCYCP